MPRHESSPVSPPSEIVEKVPKGKDRFVRISTEIPGVSLRYEPGIEPDIHKMTTRAFLETAKEHAVRYFQIKDLQGPQKKSDEEIKALAQTHEGLRGIQSEEDDFTLSVFPKDSVIWDPQLLRESLDIAYSSVVHEDLVFDSNRSIKRNFTKSWFIRRGSCKNHGNKSSTEN